MEQVKIIKRQFQAVPAEISIGTAQTTTTGFQITSVTVFGFRCHSEITNANCVDWCHNQVIGNQVKISAFETLRLLPKQAKCIAH